MTIGATWPHISGGIGVKDIFDSQAWATLVHRLCSS
jgi:hypothetical protein